MKNLFTLITAFSLSLLVAGQSTSNSSFAELTNATLERKGEGAKASPLDVFYAEPEQLFGFNYIYGNGPSNSQYFIVTYSGENFGVLWVTSFIQAVGYYQISIDNINWTDWLNIVIPYTPPINTVTAKVYVRLKAGLIPGDYAESVRCHIETSGYPTWDLYVPCQGFVLDLPETMTATPSLLDGFNYVYQHGPSASQSFVLNYSGGCAGTLAVTGSTHYQVSADNTNWSPVTAFWVPYTPPISTFTGTVYVRLAAGEIPGDYEETIHCDLDCAYAFVNCFGKVTSPPASSRYSWTGNTRNSDYQDPNNWVPPRLSGTIANDDILTFRYQGGNPVTTITNIPSETIGQLNIGAPYNITLQAAAANTTLTIGGSSEATPDLLISGGAALNVSGSNPLTIVLNEGTNGQVEGFASFSSEGPLILKPLSDLTVFGTLGTAGTGSIIIKSDVTGSGSLIESNGVNATVEHYISGASTAWHFLSSPVASQAISPAFTVPTASEYDFFAWDEPTGTWVNFKNTTVAPTWSTANGSTDITAGKGYLVEYLGTDLTKQFEGNVNTGIVSYTLSKTGSGTYSGYNLAGNPYPSAIDWKAASGWDRSNLLNPGSCDMSIWNDAAGQYGTFNSAGSSGTNGVTQYIPAGQGFMVQAASPGSLGMNNGIRVHNSQGSLKSTDEISNILRLKVSGTANSYSDEIVIEFGHQTDVGGAEKMFSMYETAPSLYTVKPTGNYSIDFRGKPGAIVIPVSFKAGIDGNYALTASQFESFSSSTLITLEDVKTNKTQNLMQNPTYIFSAAKNDEGSRFFLHFGGTFSLNDKGKEQPVSIYSSGNSIYISDKSGTFLKGEVILYNMIGQQVMRKQLSENPLTKIDLCGSTGYYLVKVVTVGNTYSGKVFIGQE